MAKQKFGYMKCRECGERVVVKRNENDTLSYRCDECDAVAYAKKTDAFHHRWMAAIEKVAAPAPSPAPASKGNPPPAPAPKPEKKKAGLPWES